MCAEHFSRNIEIENSFVLMLAKWVCNSREHTSSNVACTLYARYILNAHSHAYRIFPIIFHCSILTYDLFVCMSGGRTFCRRCCCSKLNAIYWISYFCEWAFSSILFGSVWMRILSFILNSFINSLFLLLNIVLLSQFPSTCTLGDPYISEKFPVHLRFSFGIYCIIYVFIRSGK